MNFTSSMQSDSRSIDEINPRCRVTAMHTEYSEPGLLDATPAHTHSRGQLVLVSRGLHAIEVPEGSWLVPPRHAVWIPPGTLHRFSGRFAERGQSVSSALLYVAADASPRLPRECRVIEVSPLLRELVAKAVEIPLHYDEQGRDGRVMGLIVDEICGAPVIPLRLPMPRDPRLLRVCHALLDNPGNEDNLGDWARFGSIGLRTLTRLFRDETGMTFSMWRQQVRLTEALARLAAGASVTAVALDLGYESPSAFSAMFRRVMGQTPKEHTTRLASNDGANHAMRAARQCGAA
ncbi:AraC family transcriptional regulator [Paraburkholderia sp. D1E]|uniref:AraC family transcriptional regulator n=1 Tax=Paraburkholderia sp. D1E TaxID=3461398 RepID=UPI004046661A